MKESQHKKIIDFDHECWICGTKETYNVCPSCAADIFLANNGKKGTNKIIQYLKDHNTDRFNEMIKQINNLKKLNPS